MANPIKIYKTLEEAYNALLKGFRSIQKREPNPIENQMIKAEAEGKIKSQGDNISIFPEDKPEGIMSQAPGIKSGEVLDVSFKPGMDKTGKTVKESPSQRQADLDRPFVTEQEMSAFTLEDNARKLNKAKGFIDKLGAKTSRQKLFVADLVEDAGQGIFQDVDMGAVVRSNMFDDLIEQGIDDDLLTNIMYSGTKSDDFGTTLAKIKSNAMDEGADIGETVDFYERVFDEVSRVKKAMGGRIGYAVGTGIKLAKFFKDKGTTLAAEIRKAVDNIFASGDSKYDADVAVDSALEEFGVDREMFDQMDIIDAYDKAYQTIVTQRGLASGKVPGGAIDLDKTNTTVDNLGGDKTDPFSKDFDFEGEVNLQTDIARLKEMGAGKLAERFELKQRFPGIDEELLTNIIEDTNPQHKAEVIATLDETFKMMQTGKGPEEIIDILEQGKKTRKDNAQGGLNYLMGL